MYSCPMKKEPPNPTEFNETVWHIVKQVPFGKVSTYGQIASMIPAHRDSIDEEHRKLAPYWVGQAMNRAREIDAIPWQRIINGQGKIAMPTGSQGATEQRQRLLTEGLEFDAQERIDLGTFGWSGPDDDWLTEHGLLPPKQFKQNKVDADNQQLRLF